MSAARSERLLNLMITLLVARQPVTKKRLRDVIEGYRSSSNEAFEKMFERDKEELRSLGIPISLEALDKYFDDEQGYLIHRDALELPEISLAPDEAAVVGLAARVWQHAGLAKATSAAIVKLKAAGADVEREALDLVEPAVNVVEPSFDALWAATLSRTPVSFHYQRAGQNVAKPRRLQPWGMITARGRWYVVGHDLDRGEPRMFRLSRIPGEVELGESGTYEVPAGTDIRALSERLAPTRPQHVAQLRVRVGRAHDLRRLAVKVESGPNGWDTLRVSFGDTEAFAGDLASHLDAVEVLSPVDLRAAVISRLRAAAGVA